MPSKRARSARPNSSSSALAQSPEAAASGGPPWTNRVGVTLLYGYLGIAGIFLTYWLVAYSSKTLPRAYAGPFLSTWAFVTLVGAAFWGLLALFAIPDAIRGIAQAIVGSASATGKPRQLAQKITRGAALALLLFYLPYNVFRAHGWRAEKEFDDVMAVSNAHVLLNHRFNHHMMFFRSFIRMGFVAAVLPVQADEKMALPVKTKSPSDNFRRMWWVYKDRAGRNPGVAGVAQIYPQVSVVCWAFALLLAPLGFRILQRCGLPWWAAAGAAYFAARWFSNSVETLLTQTFTYLVGFLMLQSALAVLAGGRWRLLKCVLAGVALGLGGLTMNTLAVLAIGIAAEVAVVWHGAEPARRRQLLQEAGVIVAIAATMTLVWYEAYLRGFVFENRLFNLEVQETMNLMKYTPLSVAEIVRVHTEVYGRTGVLYVIPLAVAGAVWGVRRPQYALMLSIAIIGFLVLFSVPFVFRRFIMYSIPAVAWLAAVGGMEGAMRAQAWLRRATQ